MLKYGAKLRVFPLSEIQEDIQATIDEEMNSSDPEVQANLKVFWKQTTHTRGIYLYSKLKEKFNTFICKGV